MIGVWAVLKPPSGIAPTLARQHDADGGEGGSSTAHTHDHDAHHVIVTVTEY
ncbi:MAG: hypothetical protein M3008_00695 [Chloroflexota bacterium]|nr:hypothetical protein [Chloroflexota bacterium]